MFTPTTLIRLACCSCLVMSVAASAGGLPLPRLNGPTLTKTPGAACPTAYTVFPNVPFIEYPDASVLVSSKLIANVSAESIQAERTADAQPYLNVPAGASRLGGFAQVTQGTNLYQIHYRSTNVNDEPTLVSGLVAIPGTSADGGIVVYMHATEVSQIAGAPSTPSNEACAMITAFAGDNRVVAMPDYLGYGINNDLHPYPLGVDNAPSGIDIIQATRELVASLNDGQFPGPGLFITGYSEGGGNSLWLARKLQETGDSTLLPTLVAPMAGNYDMTGATAHSLVVEQPLNLLTVAVKPFLLTFTAQAAWEMKNLDPNTLISSELVSWDEANTLPLRVDGKSEVTQALARLQLAAFHSGYVHPFADPVVLMTKKLAAAIILNDTRNPAVALWAQNNNLKWTPNMPVYATGVLQDEIVPFAGKNYPVPANYDGGAPFFRQGNSQNLIASMRARGLGPDRVAWCGIDGTRVNVGGLLKQKITHLSGLIPVSILAARFIAQADLDGLPQLPDP